MRSGTITFYEGQSCEVDVYLQHMLPHVELKFKINVMARIPTFGVPGLKKKVYKKCQVPIKLVSNFL